MGDPGLFQKIPGIPVLLPQGSGDREQAAAADRTLAGLDAMADLARPAGLLQCGPVDCSVFVAMPLGK
jgi:hypothetical protein